MPAQISYYVPSTPSPTATPTGQTPATPDVPDENDVAAQARGLGLLSRSRGNLSTILTGFRGILGQNATAPQRKTLLGE
jgi:hypothetical protein